MLTLMSGTKNNAVRLGSEEEAALVRDITIQPKSSPALASHWQANKEQEGILRDLHATSTELAGVVGSNLAESLLTKLYRRGTLLWTENEWVRYATRLGGKVAGRVGQTRIAAPTDSAPGANGQSGPNLVATQNIEDPSTSSPPAETEESVGRDSEDAGDDPEGPFRFEGHRPQPNSP